MLFEMRSANTVSCEGTCFRTPDVCSSCLPPCVGYLAGNTFFSSSPNASGSWLISRYQEDPARPSSCEPRPALCLPCFSLIILVSTCMSISVMGESVDEAQMQRASGNKDGAFKRRKKGPQGDRDSVKRRIVSPERVA